MEQKIWLITGVSKGLGREIARSAIEKGDTVIGTVRTSEDKVSFENEFNSKALIIDLAETDKIQDLVDEIISIYGRIDVLVNNAGYGAFGMIEEFSEAEIRKHLNVNFIAVWQLCKAVIPSMRKRREGHIIQISSRLGLVSGVGNGIYASGKFAMEGLSESLAQELKPFGIKVMLVEPGAMKTDFFGGSVNYAKNPIADYIPDLGDIRQKTKSVHGNQSGNPVKVAKIIIDLVADNRDIFRLPISKGTIEAMELKIKELQKLISDFGPLAKSVDE